MDEELFNVDLRKFLKQFGVAAQREIERAVRKGLEDGTLDQRRPVKVRAKLEVESMDTDLVIEDELRLSAS